MSLLDLGISLTLITFELLFFNYVHLLKFWKDMFI